MYSGDYDCVYRELKKRLDDYGTKMVNDNASVDSNTQVFGKIFDVDKEHHGKVIHYQSLSGNRS